MKITLFSNLNNFSALQKEISPFLSSAFLRFLLIPSDWIASLENFVPFSNYPIVWQAWLLTSCHFESCSQGERISTRSGANSNQISAMLEIIQSGLRRGGGECVRECVSSSLFLSLSQRRWRYWRGIGGSKHLSRALSLKKRTKWREAHLLGACHSKQPLITHSIIPLSDDFPAFYIIWSSLESISENKPPNCVVARPVLFFYCSPAWQR